MARHFRLFSSVSASSQAVKNDDIAHLIPNAIVKPNAKQLPRKNSLHTASQLATTIEPWGNCFPFSVDIPALIFIPSGGVARIHLPIEFKGNTAQMRWRFPFNPARLIVRPLFISPFLDAGPAPLTEPPGVRPVHSLQAYWRDS
jgi:hypothetical protein